LLCDWCGRRQEVPDPKEGEAAAVEQGLQAASVSSDFPRARPSSGWRGYFRGSKIWPFLKADPLMLAVFVLVGLIALRALLALSGLWGWPGFLGIVVNALAIAAFLGLISWRYWAWFIVMVTQALAVLFSGPAFVVAFRKPGLLPIVFLQFAAHIFILAVLWARRDYFD